MIGALVLAAGSSRRFGDDKRKATLPSGKTVIQQSLETALACFEEVVLVLRYGDVEFEDEMHALIDSPKLRIFRAPESALGMGHSLANAIGETKGWDAAFIFLADMPHVHTTTIDLLKSAMIEQYDQKPIIVPTHNGKWGHPVGFHHAYFAEIAELTGDHGARPVINNHEPNVYQMAVEDPGVLQDVDTPEDL